MKRAMRIIILLFFFALLAGTAIVMLRYAARQQQAAVCGREQIDIERGSFEIYLQNRDIENWLARHEISIKGRKSDEVNAALIEKVLLKNPYVGGAQVFMTRDGVCHLEVAQRNPFLKVVTSNGTMFQIDRKGIEMPVNTDYAVRLRVASGYIPVTPQYGADVTAIADTLRASVLKRLYEINVFLAENPFWDAMFEQIYVTYAGEYELIPKVGGQLVKLGKVADMADLADKLKRLDLFYRKGVNAGGWDKYSVLNLKYANQLVATKKTVF
ncbi:MAG: hypothetical protein NC048_01435 [Bacteroides sp.]|nr:hypothetical protein [Ruminococcus flavefaciens]MCM1554143.1 hypothetical protein [Bacteroides sp.]